MFIHSWWKRQNSWMQEGTIRNMMVKTAIFQSMLLLSCFSHVWLCDPIDSSPPGSAIPGILQPRTLEWVAISFSNAWKWKVKVKLLSHVRLLATPQTTAHKAPHPWDFPGKNTGVGCHFLLLSVCYYMLNTILSLKFNLHNNSMQ